MWCPQCQSDVAAEVSATDHRARCATCGGDLIVPSAAPTATRTRHALQLLERWSRPDLLDPFNPERVADVAEEAEEPAAEHERDGEPAVYEIEAPAANEDSPTLTPSEVPDMSTPTEPTIPVHETYPPTAPLQYAIPPHTAHAGMPAAAPAPHLPNPHAPVETNDVQLAIHSEPRTNWVALTGQLLAYAGVAVLTIGTTLALWGYFAGETQHVPTGWLVASAGQMLLFLGVVTLVSSGMEQASRDLNERLERVSAKLDRVEHRVAAATPPQPAYGEPTSRAA